jgi:hypothetical protein
MCHSDIPAGTLLMEEAPFVTWPAHTGEELLNEYVIKILLRNKNHAIVCAAFLSSIHSLAYLTS